MTEFPDTRDSLLVQIRDPQNAVAWEQFAQIYRPVIYRLARQRGMQDVDAQDLAQQVLIAVAGAIGRWEAHGEDVRFRHWLRRVVRNAAINALSRKPRDAAVGGDSVQALLLRQAEPDQQLESQMEVEYRRELFTRAAEIVRTDVHPETWSAFEWTVIEGKDIAAVAAQLRKPTGAVYTARSRVMHRLRAAIQKLEDVE